MNKKLVFGITGRLLEALGIIMLLPMVVSVIYKELSSVFAFLVTAFISFAIGFVLRVATRNRSHVLYAKEGFLIVALAWLSTSFIGCLPFVISGAIPSLVDAFFETASGFTTTGASILTDIEALSHGMLFWRSFSHWIGGMGVLVFIIAFISNDSERSIHILRAEMPGPTVGKLVPRSKDTSKVLYIIYIGITLLEIILLLAGGMPIFESVLHSFGTAGTGGFGVKSDSIASYSPYCQWVIATFMLIFSVNFNIYFLLIIKRWKNVLKSTELWSFFAIVVISTALITTDLCIDAGIFSLDTLRHAFFQVNTIISTTGYSSIDFNLWPSLSKSILFILMFIGGCAGSTAGGLKVSRVIILFKMIKKEIKQMIHPRAVATVKLEGKEVDSHSQRSVATYFAIYMICLIFIFFVISVLEPFDFESLFTAASACFNNVGPGFGIVGPAGSYAAFTDASKILLAIAMIFGRLEIFPILIALIPSTWKKH